jgi:hypothetical protein
MKIFIGIPHSGTIRTETMLSIFAVFSGTPEHELRIAAMRSTYIDYGRALIVKAAVEWGADRLLFVDSDMEFDGDVLNRLLTHDAEVVGVNYFTRDQQASVSTVKLIGTEGPTGETGLGPMPQGPFECFAVGTGLMLIDVNVFAKIPQPYFRNTYDPESGTIIYGDDTWFCKLVRDAGLAVLCDPTIPVGHVGDYLYVGQPETLGVTVQRNGAGRSLAATFSRAVKRFTGRNKAKRNGGRASR